MLKLKPSAAGIFMRTIHLCLTGWHKVTTCYNALCVLKVTTCYASTMPCVRSSKPSACFYFHADHSFVPYRLAQGHNVTIHSCLTGYRLAQGHNVLRFIRALQVGTRSQRDHSFVPYRLQVGTRSQGQGHNVLRFNNALCVLKQAIRMLLHAHTDVLAMCLVAAT